MFETYLPNTVLKLIPKWNGTAQLGLTALFTPNPCIGTIRCLYKYQTGYWQIMCFGIVLKKPSKFLVPGKISNSEMLMTK